MQNLHDFYCGTMFDAYEYFGAHPCFIEQEAGVMFRVYAPGAVKVAVIGEFNGWQGELMTQEGGGGIYSYFSKFAYPGMMYKYRIYHKNGTVMDKSDPYGFGMELRPNSASVIVDLKSYQFTDWDWMNQREKNYNRPMNVYELHLGSWKYKEKNEKKWFTYGEMAACLIPYCKEHNFTHIELLPVMEHPADCSWGYQVSGFYAPTSRYGSARDLMDFVNQCHLADIGVLADFVPVHFAVDSYGLGRFDGNALYEYPSNDIGCSEWGSYSFNYYRGEVCSFLQSAANYWLSEYHLDGLRVDAVSNIIYWKGNVNSGVNEGGIRFLRGMNEGLLKRHPSAMLIAEDSSAYAKVTAPIKYNGLGFDYKWDMGFMNDTLDYFKTPPQEREYHHGKLLFSMHYFYNELFVLPFSHDEVVHGKATILQKMWGDYEDKFRQARTLYTYMFTRPGKKLNFMGNELGHFREWNEDEEMDWMLITYPRHDEFHRYFKSLSALYAKTPALYEGEYDSRSFRFIETEARKECVYVYERICEKGRILVLLNMSDREYRDFMFGYDRDMVFDRVLNSNAAYFGGDDIINEEIIAAEKIPYKHWEYSMKTTLAPFSSKVFKAKMDVYM